MKSYKELVQDRVELEKKISEARKNEIAGALAQIRSLMEEFQLSERDVFPSSGSKARAANSTSGNHATTTGGLHDRDVEFLIRYAARADAVAEQLKSAQALIKQDRELCNGQTETTDSKEKIVSQGTSRGAPQAGAKTSQVFISA